MVGRAKERCAARAKEVLRARHCIAHWQGDVVEREGPKRWGFFV